MLGAAKPDSLRAERNCVGYLLGRIGVCAHTEHAEFIRPLHQLRVLLVNDAFLWVERSVDEHLHNLRRRCGDFAGKNFSSGTIDGNVIPPIQRRAVRAKRALLIIDLNSSRPAHAHFSHLPRNQGGVRRNTATRRENSFSRDHAAQILRRGFNAGEHNFLASFGAKHSFLGIKNHATACRAWSGRQAAADSFCDFNRLQIEDRRQKVSERICRNTAHRVFPGY